jgi:hypothetical protein
MNHLTVRGPDSEAAQAAIAAIARRRAACGDESLELLPTHPLSVLGVLQYVRSHRDVPHGVLADDAADCLELLRYLLAEVPRTAHATLRMARAVGVPWRRIGKAFGLSPQGAAQWYLRLDEEQQGGNRSEVAARQRRRAAEAPPDPRIRKEMWLDTHAAEILAAAKAMIAAAPDGAPELAEEADRRFPVIPDVMLWLGQAIHDYSPGLCPPAEKLAGEWGTLSG